MKTTQHLLERKYFLIAIIWTLSITALSLISLEGRTPSLAFKNTDKVVHALFYFFFTFFWSRACKNKKVILIMLLAVLYGIVIEVLQTTITATREADFYDVLANSLGAFLAMLVLKVINKNL
ncbi:VanZ family protein [Flavobacterium chuncheonense]|uniref:VanZ family protein n=1 Tax=Flavobacterium chuncheonense TaxID=2026653 RepID=UPI0036D41B44